MLIRVSAVIALLLAAQVGVAATVTADFEPGSGYVTGPMPTKLGPGTYGNGYYSGPNSLGGQPAGAGSTWGVGGYTSDPGENPDAFGQPAFVIADPTNASNNVASFTGSSSGAPINPSEMYLPVTVNPTGVTTLSTRLFYPSALNTGLPTNLQIAFMNVVVNFGTSHSYNAQWGGDDSKVLVLDANGTDTPQLAMDAWHNLAIAVTPNVADLANSTASVSVDGSPLATYAVNLNNDHALSNDWGVTHYGSLLPWNQTKVDMWMDETNGIGTDQVYVDDLTITNVTPEPATLALIALGGLALLRRRANA